MKLDTNFPGGNAIIEKSENSILIKPDLRDTIGDWFYWCFRVNEPKQEKLCFTLNLRKHSPQNSIAYSIDQGFTWRWLPKENIKENAFEYTPDKEHKEIRFSMGMPYTYENWSHFTETIKNNDLFKLNQLCQTKNGNVAPLLSINSNSNNNKGIYITARHHCCEMMANYVIEGIINQLISNSTWLEEGISIYILPFMDIDGVQNGDQGKNRAPHDHNRDYTEKPIYETVRALQQVIKDSSESKIISLDIHCPGLNGEWNEKIYSVGSRFDKTWEQQKIFADILEKTNQSSLPYRSKNDLPFGEAWNNGNAIGQNCSNWFAQQSRTIFSTSMEIPYHQADGVEINQNTARDFGESLCKTLLIYAKNL